MPYVTTKDGAQIFYKDWGPQTAQRSCSPMAGHCPATMWDKQMVFLGERGYRVIAHDRRSHGRSTQTWDGNHMDQYADDLAVLIDTLDLRKSCSWSGTPPAAARVTHYLGRHGTDARPRRCCWARCRR